MRNANSSLPYPQPTIDTTDPTRYALSIRFGGGSECLATNLQTTIGTLNQPFCKPCKSLCHKPSTTQDYKTQNTQRIMQVFPYSNNDIQQRTSLKLDFINHCNSKLGDLLAPFRIKGDKNKLLYNDSGLRLWDVIKQHKERGENIRQIREALERIVRPNSQTTEPTSRPTTETFQTNQQSSQSMEEKGESSQAQIFTDGFIRMGREHRKEIKEQHQETTDALRGEVKSLKEQMLLLADGRTPEEIKEEANKVVEDRAALGRLLQTNKRTQELVVELEGLMGKWGKGKRRREILIELKQ